MTGTREKISFDNISYLYNDYGGMDWIDFELMKRQLTVQASDNDTGFGNVPYRNGEVITIGYDDGATYANFLSHGGQATFNLRSGWFASPSIHYGVLIEASRYNDHGVLTPAGYLYVYVPPSGMRIDFANYGKTFKHINFIHIFSFDHYVAMDNLKVTFNGPIPAGHEHGFAPGHPHHPPHIAGRAAPPVELKHWGDGMHASPDYHSQILSLDAARDHSADGLTDRFALPAADHWFGT